jgi:hypothetical protein
MQLDQQEKEFESWDLREPAVPQRSELFHLKPIGLQIGSSAFCLSRSLNAPHHDSAQGGQTKYVFLRGELQSRAATMPYLRTQQHR